MISQALSLAVLVLAAAPAPAPAPAPAGKLSNDASSDGSRKENTVANSGNEPQGGATRETAVLAGGCFWGMEDLLRKLPGVIETEVGYAGGELQSPSYEQVKSGTTGAAEALQVVFDPGVLSYESLLRMYFRIHDPTTPNRQGNDVGTQYRSAIFVQSDEQQAAAERVRAEVDRSGKWKKPLVTEIVSGGSFYPAEGYHQDYLEKHPGGYSCHWVRD